MPLALWKVDNKVDKFRMMTLTKIRKYCTIKPCRGGEIGRHTGLKILRSGDTPCRFESGPRHHLFLSFQAISQEFLSRLRAMS